MNEELTTLNSQLQAKVHELTAANDDLASLLISTDIATVFLDVELRIKRFTTAASHVLNLRSSDIGRPISHIVPNLVGVNLPGIARAVLDELAPIEQEVAGQDGSEFIARALPYPTGGKAVQGVVLTFVDVTTLKRSERELRTAREQLAEELRRTRSLQTLGMDLLAPRDLSSLLQEVLRAALEITGADMGNLQVADRHGVLTIAAHSGFARPFLEHFARVDAHADSVCAHALASRRRVAIEDITASPLLAGSPVVPVLQGAGVRAVQSTPLFGRGGALLGMLSTHYRVAHAFEDADTRWLDLLAIRTTILIERVQLEQQLRDAMRALEQQVADQTRDLRNALDGAHAGTWHIDLRADTVHWDERSRRMFGGDALSFPFDRTFSVVHPDDRARLRERFQQLGTAGDDLWDMTFRVEHPGGAITWIHGVGRVERDAAGRPVAFNGINMDVTPQRKTEDDLRQYRLQQSEAALMIERLLDGAAEGILATTEGGLIERANLALETMFGYGRGELTGCPLERLIPEARRARHATEHVVFWNTPRSRPMGQGLDLAGQRKDGTTFPVEVSLTHVGTATGGRVLAFVADITGRKRAEAELRRSHAVLQMQADQLRHRTEQLRRLASDLTLSEQQTREQLAKTIHDHLQQLLFSAKLRVDRMASAPADATSDLPGLAGKVREDLEAAIAATRSLSVELFPPTLHQDGLTAALGWLATWMEEKYGLTVEVTADPRARLEQKDLRTLAFESVRELLFDVVKHAQVKRAAVNLTLTPDDELQIVVTDEGVGFDPSTVSGTTARPAGWGLFSIRERAALLGGHLDVQSAPGRGTRFTLVMPRTEAPHRTTPRALRILIVDDHAGARAGIREMLAERPEFEIVGEASTGAEAIALAQRLQPDAIIMDVAMPDVDGIEATRRIHAELPDIQIFGLSTQERPETLHAIEAAGAVGYFTKGDDSRQLIERLLLLHATRLSGQ